MKIDDKEQFHPFLLVSILTLVVGALIGYRLTKGPVGEELWTSILNGFSQKDLLTAEGNIHLGKLFLNNAYVAILSFLLGLCPFFYLSGAVGVINGVVIGVMLGFPSQLGMALSPWTVFWAGIMPHGIFELTAFVLAIAAGMNLCREMGRSIKGKKGWGNVKEALRAGGLFFLKVILPLLFVAALVETYLTPAILASVLGL